MKAATFYWIFSVTPFVLALAVYGWQGSRTPLLNSLLAERDHYLAAVSEQMSVDPSAEEAEAKAYWGRYPDVAANDYYGPGGPLGLLGARQHYRDHGRREGRRWGL